jgi:hypothetical protein
LGGGGRGVGVGAGGELRVGLGVGVCRGDAVGDGCAVGSPQATSSSPIKRASVRRLKTAGES